MKWIERAVAIAGLIALFAIGSALADNGTRSPRPGGGAGGDKLPTQTGNSGKFLTTNGSVPSWATATPLAAMSFPMREYVDNVSTGVTSSAGGATVGTSFFFTTAATGTGADFKYCDAAADTIRVKLWNFATGAQLSTKDVPVNGVGWYHVDWSAPVALSAWTPYQVSMFETTSTRACVFSMRVNHTGAGGFTVNMDPWNGNNSAAPFVVMGGPRFFWISWAMWVTGDGRPTGEASTERYPIQPDFTVP